jgi:hypothetical protein
MFRSWPSEYASRRIYVSRNICVYGSRRWYLIPGLRTHVFTRLLECLLTPRLRSSGERPSITYVTSSMEHRALNNRSSPNRGHRSLRSQFLSRRNRKSHLTDRKSRTFHHPRQIPVRAPIHCRRPAGRAIRFDSPIQQPSSNAERTQASCAAASTRRPGKRSTRPVKHQVNFVSFFKSAMKLCISV